MLDVDRGDVGLLAGEQVLGLGQVGQPERAELRRRLQLALDELGLHVRPAAQAPVDLDVAQLGLLVHAAAEPQGDRGEDEADDRDDRADRLDGDAELGDPEELEDHGTAGQQDPDRDQRQGDT